MILRIHLHRGADVADVGSFRFLTCRCGHVRLLWRSDRRGWRWRSRWHASAELARAERRAAFREMAA